MAIATEALRETEGAVRARALLRAAASGRGDPWKLAERLRILADARSAQQYVRGLKDLSDAAAIRTYLEGAPAGPTDASGLDLMESARRAHKKGRPAETLRLLRAIKWSAEIEKRPTVLWVEAATMRMLAFESLGQRRLAEVAAAAAARGADHVGWASAVTRSLGRYAYRKVYASRVIEEGHNPTPVGARQAVIRIARRLDRETMAIHVTRLGQSTIAIILRSGNVRVKLLGDADTLESQLSRIARGGVDELTRIRGLALQLRKVLPPETGIRRLVIATDDVYLWLPFESTFPSTIVLRIGCLASLEMKSICVEPRLGDVGVVDPTSRIVRTANMISWRGLRGPQADWATTQAMLAGRKRWRALVVNCPIRLLGTPRQAGMEIGGASVSLNRMAFAFQRRDQTPIGCVVLSGGVEIRDLRCASDLSRSISEFAMRSRADAVLIATTAMPMRQSIGFLDRVGLEDRGAVREMSWGKLVTLARTRVAGGSDDALAVLGAWQLWIG